MHAIYERYPMMRPYVGANYERGGPRSLLLIGESHYLPEVSTQHRDAEGWYRGDASTLDAKEREWIDVAEIIRGSSAGGFPNKAHWIYRNSFVEINRRGPNFPDFRTVGETVVFYNYFLRPARKGDSLRLCEEDERIAEDVFRAVFAEYRPSAVAFLSKLAYWSWQAHSVGTISVPVSSTPHPSCVHWNRTCAKYGNKRGRDVLGEFVERIWRP